MFKQQKTYPDTTFSSAAAEAGAAVHCIWEMSGPPGTLITYLSCYGVNGRIAIVQTLSGGGWGVFTSGGDTREKMLADALARCGVTRTAETA